MFKRSASEAFGGSPLDPSSGGHGEQPEESDRLGSSHKNLKDQQSSQDLNNGLTSFSVQIVQQFSSNNNAQAPHSQTIQTNVTVKALSGNGGGGATAGIKTSGSPLPPTSASSACDSAPTAHIFKECKREKVECEFQPQCSMSSSNGANVDPLSNFNLMTDESVDDVINAELFQDLINDVFTNTSNADLMKEFTFDNIGVVKEPDDGARAASADSSCANLKKNTSTTSQHHQRVSSTPPQYSSSPTALANPTSTNLFEIQQQQTVTNIPPIAPSPGSRIPTPLEVIQSPGTGPNPAAQTLKQMAEQHQQQKQQHIGNAPHQRVPFADSLQNSRDFFANSQSPSFTSSMPSKPMYNPAYGMQQQNMYTNGPTEPGGDSEVQNHKVMQLQQQLQRMTEQKSPPPGYGSTRPLSHYAEMSSQPASVAPGGGINVQQQQHLSPASGQFMRAQRGGVAGAGAASQQQQQQAQYMGAAGGSPSNASSGSTGSNIQISQSQHFSQTNQQMQVGESLFLLPQVIKNKTERYLSSSVWSFQKLLELY